MTPQQRVQIKELFDEHRQRIAEAFATMEYNALTLPECHWEKILDVVTAEGIDKEAMKEALALAASRISIQKFLMEYVQIMAAQTQAVCNVQEIIRK